MENDAPDPAKIARFWSHVDRSGGPSACWPWTGSAFREGYGNATVISGLPAAPGGRRTTAHRQAWIITNGHPGTHVAPSGKVVANRVRHRCPGGPNRLCCNPAHLAIGSDKDNADDRHADGNTHRGEQVAIARLTEVTVREALVSHAGGVSVDTLAERYGVHRSTMVSALSGETTPASPLLARRMTAGVRRPQRVRRPPAPPPSVPHPKEYPMTDNGPATAMPETSQVFDLATAVRDCIIALKDATERSIERLDAVISNLEGQQ